MQLRILPCGPRPSGFAPTAARNASRCIRVSTRARRWYPLHHRRMARPRERAGIDRPIPGDGIRACGLSRVWHVSRGYRRYEHRVLQWHHGICRCLGVHPRPRLRSLIRCPDPQESGRATLGSMGASPTFDSPNFQPCPRQSRCCICTGCGNVCERFIRLHPRP